MDPKLKFAVVREDPEIERRLVESSGARSILIVASGGCTVLSLELGFPELEIVAFDINARQIEHIDAKRAAARRGDTTRLNVADRSANHLNQSGAFEGIFRLLRSTIEEFVAAPGEVEQFFASDDASRSPILERWRDSPYWPAAFSTAFNEPLLHAMFGPAATQHAEPGSYPSYFQRAFERGLSRQDAARNPFLQHVFLGFYRPQDAPDYIRRGAMLPAISAVKFVTGTLLEVPGLERFDLFSLSNVFDWSDDAQISAWFSRLDQHARIGSRLLIRQLNNQRDLTPWLKAHFQVDSALGAQLLEMDRSLFSERIIVATRVR